MSSPFAARILKELTWREKDRSPHDMGELRRKLPGAHCFEVSEIYPAAVQFAKRLHDENAPLPSTVFLPGQSVWIERRVENGRWGFLFEESVKGAECGSLTVGFSEGDQWGSSETWVFDLSNERFEVVVHGADSAVFKKGDLDAFVYELAAIFALINEPRVSDVVARSSNKNLIRELGRAGHYPLSAWSEVKLNIDRRGIDCDTTIAAMTERMPLHWVRRYMRRKTGVKVVDHWRGNAALGIVLSRYKAVREPGVPPESIPRLGG